jgi:hypothetical protein
LLKPARVRTDGYPASTDATGASLIQLIYIGGYGRSGSTLLEYLLTASHKVVACGEVSAALHARLKKKQCTCGKPVSDCTVWHHISETRGELHSWTHKDLSLALSESIASHDAVMVDSSKTAWGSATVPFALRRTLGRRFHLIHLVRDPTAVCWSAIQRHERSSAVRANRTLQCISATLGWWVANLACELFSCVYPNQYRRLCYEDLANSPREVVSSIFRAFSVEDEVHFENLGLASNRHQLYGNRMRRRSLSMDQIKPDDAWRTSMPVGYRRLVKAISWPLRSRYGYP